eukprot:364688-Prymnesium_polylepis.1
MVTKLMPILRERDAENGVSGLNSMALAIVRQPARQPRKQRNEKGSSATSTESKCKHCDLRFCKQVVGRVAQVRPPP